MTEEPQSKTAPKPANRVKVKLRKKHRHQGKDYKPGQEIAVREDQVKWLKSHGIIE
ncbi:DUF7210 family protein [Methylohalobius crimeensis]|uniref:DUF7210 family protein n=1 Tax=Methylohalobius crimeensis TaxID=244365 RepID=UPI0003B3541B|nr:hypothetical protein [Methylohalobius crimeensis]